jgi:hypothetical protein
MLPSWYAKNIWYHNEEDKDCSRLSKNKKSALFYEYLKENTNQLNDDNIISNLAAQFGLNVFINCDIPTSMGFTWKSYLKTDKQEGTTIYHLPSHNYELFVDRTIKIYNK